MVTTTAMPRLIRSELVPSTASARKRCITQLTFAVRFSDIRSV